ncbi:uncharacterized protein LOC122349153 [Puntigrus tetrazona]|uniref:uncharacterized protein LOC122349153 n=1 Tax=Puntigrus tetrazona TaxID=1606681 RepID=UPI001C896690|nr:uncharacterized protein LOC122349153 [Puntigrus tetrazona]
MAVKIAVPMKVRMISLPLVFMLIISGLCEEKWGVTYETESICALKGSTVNMSCSYKYPQQYKLINTFWIKMPDVAIKSLKEYPEYKDRVEYIEDRQKQTAVLRLHNITENDKRAYCFRLITETKGQYWIGPPGIQLNVSALQVKAPQLVLEKEAFNLTCETTCSLTDAFIWYKNGQTLTIQSQTLQLESERSDSGRYSCAVREHQHLPSPALNISVMYPPQNVSVSVSPSAEVVEGDSVTLICSSDSNPPALNFSWFKENQSSAVGSEQSLIISSFNSRLSGLYYCEAQNQLGSRRSASVSVSVKGDWNILYIIAVCVTAVVLAGFGLLFLIIIIVHQRKGNNDYEDTEQKTSAGKASESREAENTSVQDTKKPDEDEIEYASIIIHHPVNEAKSPVSQETDISVIYSSDAARNAVQYLLQINKAHLEPEGMERLQFSTTMKKAALFLLNLRGTTSLVCQSRGIVPRIHAMLQRRVSQDSPTTSRDLGYSGRISSTSSALPLRSLKVLVVIRMILSFHLIFLLMAAGVIAWNVTYETESICALKGSTVNMSCSYTYPQQYNFTFWIMCEKKDIEIKSLKEYPDYKDRVEYIEETQNKTILRLHNITENDQRAYCFSLITETEGQRWIGQPGIQLNVSALQVKAPQLVLEKEAFNLTCETTCSLTDAFIWYKNGQTLTIQSQTLQFESERSDSGRYSCAVREHQHLPSPALNISVMYPPQNVSVSVSPSAEVVEGDSVTLICSSDSNPPALNFSWFKENQSSAVGSEQSLIISNISSEHSGEYKCRSTNIHGEKDSDAVNVNVMYPPRNVSVSVSPSAEVVEGDSVTLICSSDSNPPALSFSWFKGGKSVGSGRIFNISNISSEHSGEYKCRSKNNHGEKDSDAVNVNVTYPPRSVRVSVSPSAEVVEGDSVTLICSSDSNPPALNFSWFKENQSSAVGSEQSLIISSFNSRLSGLYYCEAQNQLGFQRSASVSVSVKGAWTFLYIIGLYATITLAAAFGLLFLIIIIIIIIIIVHKMSARKKIKNDDYLENDIYLNDTESKKASSESEDDDNINYASVLYHKQNEDTEQPEEDEIQYDNITINRPATEAKSTEDQEKDLSVIYSSIKKSA